MIISSFITTKEHLRPCRKWLVASLVFFYSIEVNYILVEVYLTKKIINIFNLYL
jgi:hypothetical protein